ncbi:nitronate monooxygenase [Sphingomonas sp. NSE70-1]|uniref:Propionate 3-nitronate monooxygenase n=1 Tax=Sphingomonas caseinilyticus TaxID=2908205 RepID=A0ABT0RW61_9SPHN|nr:nitronate monooxygenase [Sphingomonas caseinilyticus]MCL6699267.1 nitronate monooxygenase [Sphingomonas caseinilyticus]
MAHSRLLDRIGIALPIIQAPMAGVSTPAMAAAVSEAGGLGSIAVGATDAAGAEVMIAEVRERTALPFNVNLFCHRPAQANAEIESRWIERFRPRFAEFGALPPAKLTEIYRSFVGDEEMFSLLIKVRPVVVSFHFGLPRREWCHSLRDAGIILLATATSVAEARAAADAGADAIVAQGWEAGGHRGMLDPDAKDERLPALDLVHLILGELDIPVIAAGGIMDGAGIARALEVGACAAQLGTAFIACDESAADQAFRAALVSPAAHKTVMTRAISGRPARCLANRFTALGQNIADSEIPAYPIAYDLGKALNSAAKARGEYGFGAQWAGEGAPRFRSMPAGKLVEVLAAELRQTNIPVEGNCHE